MVRYFGLIIRTDLWKLSWRKLVYIHVLIKGDGLVRNVILDIICIAMEMRTMFANNIAERKLESYKLNQKRAVPVMLKDKSKRGTEFSQYLGGARPVQIVLAN